MKKHILFSAALMALLCPTVLQAQTTNSDLLVGFNRAHAVLMKGMRALGPADRLSSFPAFKLRIDGSIAWRHQSRRPDGYDATNFAAVFIYMPSGDSIVYDNAFEYPGGFHGHQRQVRTPAESFTLNLLDQTTSSVSAEGTQEFQYLLDRITHHVLARVLQTPAALRWIGLASYQNRPHEVVEGRLGNTTARLFFDSASALLTKYEALIHDPFEGAIVQERIFGEYIPFSGVLVPTTWLQRTAGKLTHKYRFEWHTVDRAVDAHYFERPVGFADVSGSNATERVTEVADGVYLVEDVVPAYNVMFFEFADYVLVAEAPAGSNVGERIIQIIKRTIPRKPIRYIVQSHHHDDHAAGLRPFIAEGATIVTTPGNVELFRDMASSRFTLAPDRLTLQPTAPSFDVVSGRPFTIADPSQRVVIYDIGSGPHAEEMLIIFHPASGILFQADLWNPYPPNSRRPVNETTLHFARWLKASRLPVRSIAGVHSSLKPIAEFREAVQRASDIPSR